MDDDNFEQIILDLFGSLTFDRFQAAGLPEDRYPTYSSLLSHIRECLDEQKFGNWVTQFIGLESVEDPSHPINVVRLTSSE